MRKEELQPTQRTLYSMICERSASSPEALAILALDRQPITYRQLADQIAFISLQLNQLGFRHTDRIAVALPNGPEMLAAYLTVSAVCACAPLNPASQANEFIFAMTDMRAKAVVVQRGITPLARQAADKLGIPVIELEPDLTHGGLFHLQSNLPVDATIQEPTFADLDDFALLLHTSGTTSVPKIVPITQRNIFYSVNNAAKALSLTTFDRCLNIMPLFNIHGLVAVALASIAAGASIICTPGFISHKIMNWISTQSPTWYSAVPSLHLAVLDQARMQPEKSRAAHLRMIRSASSSLSAQLAHDLASVFGTEVREALGMTEATGGITIVRLPPPAGKEGTVGVPQGTSKMCAMDEAGNTLPANALGELCLSGENVVSGYENNPQANVASFVNGWFRTGDLGYVDEDGYVFIEGRVKEIINRGGAKISPREVDDVLLRHPAVSQAAAFAVPHPTLGEDVAAAVVLREGQVASLQELRQFAALHLADFKVPRQIVFIKEIPKNAVGKVQRIGMAEVLKKELDALQVRETGGQSGPLNEIEADIQSIWQEVLGMAHVGINDDYLVMGGDSIRAGIILMNVNERFGTNLLISDIFDTPTVKTMAEVVQAHMETGSPVPSMPPIKRQGLKETPLSPAQESLWLIQQIDPLTVAYNFSFLFKLTGGVDRKILEFALNELVQRHESLRTIYPSQEGIPYQVIMQFEPFSLPVVDYSGLPPREREAAIHRYASEHENIPFNLEQEISGRYALLHASPDDDYLYICMHHINWDAWSHFVFTADLMQLYSACRLGEKPDLPALPIQYSDYALAHAEWFKGETCAAYVEHWKNILTGELSTLELPTDHPRPAKQTDHGARYNFTLSSELSSQIKAFSRQERLLPFHLLLAAYEILLERYSGQIEIILGCSFANRPRPEQQGLIGLFTNVLPIRSKLDGDLTIRDLLQQTHSVMLDAFTWQALPFKTLVSEIAHKRDLSRMPVYQVAINMLNVPRRTTSIPGLELSEVPREEMPAQFDLTFEFTDEGGYFSGSAIFNTDLFDRSTIARMTVHFKNILNGILAEPHRTISQIEMLSPAEHQKIIVEWNKTKREFPRDSNVYRLFEQRAMKTPDALAVIFGDKKVTYCRLNHWANQLASHLRRQGVTPGDFVGIYMGRSLEMVVAMLAILKAGGAYVPMDPTYPPERLNFMREDTNISVIVSLQNWAESLPVKLHEHLKIVLVDAEAGKISRYSSQNLPIDVGAMITAYVIYTSGSTGIPKGICIPHRAINRLVLNTDYVNITSEDRIAQASNMSFDAATFEVWGALLNGACLVGVPQEILLSPVDLARAIREQGINVLFLTTALFNQVASISPDAFGSLRDMLFGGEAVTPLWVRTILKYGAPQRLLHVYGPTETTTYATWYLVRDVAETDVNVPIGMPIANSTAYVLDDHMNPVPTGVTGALYLGGDGLSVGYHNRPELTNERFIPNPFIQEELRAGLPISERLYRTGDLVRRKQDGNIEFIGRLDNQVKLRGFRVELGEIEIALKQHPAIQAAIVAMLKDQPDNQRLVSYIVLKVDARLDKKELQKFLEAKLPRYAIPAAFMFLSSLPITPNGKIDIKALPTPPQDSLTSDEYVEPQTPVEQALAKLWAEVLGISRIGLADDFFELGGNSLSAVQVIARIKRELEVTIPIYKLFETPRLADLAEEVELAIHPSDEKSGDLEISNDREEYIL
jgi:amino acid adenylation domain-containing protein